MDRASASGAESESSSLSRGALTSRNDRRSAVFRLEATQSDRGGRPRRGTAALQSLYVQGGRSIRTVCAVDPRVRTRSDAGALDRHAGFATSTLPPTPAPSPTSAPLRPRPLRPPHRVRASRLLHCTCAAEPASASSQLGLIGPPRLCRLLERIRAATGIRSCTRRARTARAGLFSQYVQVENKEAIPSVGGRIGPGPNGVVIQQLNVRKGPGTAFDSLGTLNPKDAVTLTGKDSSSTWLQIDYSAGSDGKGWVAAELRGGLRCGCSANRGTGRPGCRHRHAHCDPGNANAHTAAGSR